MTSFVLWATSDDGDILLSAPSTTVATSHGCCRTLATWLVCLLKLAISFHINSLEFK